jgi:hypothetical protein
MEERNAHGILVEMPEEKEPLESQDVALMIIIKLR